MNLMHEALIPWTLNGQRRGAFSCTPEHLEELVRGNLFAYGQLDNPADACQISVGDEMAVQLPYPVRQEKELPEAINNLLPVTCSFSLALEEIRHLSQALCRARPLYGTHRVLIACDDQRVIRDDIGRHNALDKAVAAAFMAGFHMQHSVLGITGRITSEIFYKAARAGIPILFTRKYPSDLATELAKRLNIMVLSDVEEKAQVFGANRLKET